MPEHRCPRRKDGCHRKAAEGEHRCYTHPLRGPDEPQHQPRAHGCITTTHICRCGAEKPVNINCGFTEHGTWVPAWGRRGIDTARGCPPATVGPLLGAYVAVPRGFSIMELARVREAEHATALTRLNEEAEHAEMGL